MKYKVEPTASNEKVMRENDFIVSKTDLKGRITYGNRSSSDFRATPKPSCLARRRNIIRHPDMPRGVFKILWDNIAAGNGSSTSRTWRPDGSFTGFRQRHAGLRRSRQHHRLSLCAAGARSATRSASDRGALQGDAGGRGKAGAKDACDASLALLVGVLNEKGTEL